MDQSLIPKSTILKFPAFKLCGNKKDYRPSKNTLVKNMSKSFFFQFLYKIYYSSFQRSKLIKFCQTILEEYIFFEVGMYKKMDNLIQDDLFSLFFLCCLFTLFFSFSFSKSSSFSSSLNQIKI